MKVTQPDFRWLTAHALAIGFSLAHVILDWHLALFGTATTYLSTVQALVLILSAALYATWALALTLASHGNRRAIIATIGLAVIGGLGNGLSIAFCLPPCAGAAPFGDISHIGSLLFGGWAVVESWRLLRQR